MTNSIILVIDDTPTARDAVEALLAGENYTLEFAANGPEGLEKAITVRPDVILLDVMMPGMDGYEVCRRLRADPQTAEVPILMVTALDDRESRLEGIGAGADDFITKPYDDMELTTRLQSITRLNRYRRLQTERIRLAWVLDHANDGYLILDDQDHLQYANPRAYLYLGLPLADTAPSGRFLDLARRQYRLEPEAAWAAWPKLTTRAYLLRPESFNTRAFWLQVSTFQPAAPGSGRVIQLRDVTEQVTSHRDMRKFHTAISHKLLTPLNYLYSGLEPLADDIETLEPAEIKQLARAALAGAKRLHAELQDIFQYVNAPSLAKPGEGMALDQLPTDVGSIGTTLNLPALTVTVADDISTARLTLSRRALELILFEVLENSKKFHPEHTPAVTLTATRTPNHELRLQIVDNGLTLAPDQLAQVWSPYIQGEKHFTGEAPGMGLGLPMVATIVWQAKGQVTLTNRPDGPGVMVELILPLA